MPWTSLPSLALSQVPTELPVSSPASPADAEAFSNPVAFVESAAAALPDASNATSAPISIVLLLTLLTVAPSILILCTSFTRFVVVLGLLRQALGTQGLPPSQVIVGLSLFLTFVSMTPTLSAMWNEGLEPYLDAPMDQRDSMAAWDGMKRPLRAFMINQIAAAGNDDTVIMMVEFQGWDYETQGEPEWDDVDLVALVPAFVLSELKTAFLIAFRIFLPFLVIDMIVSSLLISMGMMMLPPVFISLPFKLLLFVVADGWTLVAGSLLESVARGGP